MPGGYKFSHVDNPVFENGCFVGISMHRRVIHTGKNWKLYPSLSKGPFFVEISIKNGVLGSPVFPGPRKSVFAPFLNL